MHWGPLDELKRLAGPADAEDSTSTSCEPGHLRAAIKVIESACVCLFDLDNFVTFAGCGVSVEKRNRDALAAALNYFYPDDRGGMPCPEEENNFYPDGPLEVPPLEKESGGV